VKRYLGTAAIAALVWLLFASAVLAGPQPPLKPAASDLGVRVGQTVSVLTADGPYLEGTVLSVDGPTLEMQTRAGRVSLPAASVRQIVADFNDSIANGAAWGLAIGAGLGAAYFAAGSSVLGCPDSCAAWGTAFVAGGAAIGGAIGIAVDAAIHSRRTVYLAQAGRPSVSVVPLLGPHVTGFQAQVRW
jgi:hypothetical protein